MHPCGEGEGEWAHEQELPDTIEALEHLRARLHDEHDSAEALRRQSAQASRRARELLANAAELAAAAERMVADARAIRGEHGASPAAE